MNHHSPRLCFFCLVLTCKIYHKKGKVIFFFCNVSTEASRDLTGVTLMYKLAAIDSLFLSSLRSPILMVQEYYESAHEANGAFSFTIGILTPAPSQIYNVTVARETIQA